MARTVTNLTFLLWLFQPFILAAQPTTADIEVNLIEAPPPLTPPGSVGMIQFTLTNHGPDYIGIPDLTSFNVHTVTDLVFDLSVGPPISFGGVAGDDCLIDFGIPDPAPGEPLTIIYSAWFAGIGPGETRTCSVLYTVNDAFSENRVVAWGYRGNSSRVDPNPTNNDFTLVFNLASPIPTLNPAGSAVLVAALFTAFVVVRRRTNVL